MRIRSYAAIVLIAAAAGCGSDSGTTTAAPTVGKIVIADILTAINPGKSLQLAVFAFNPSGQLLVNPGTFVWTSSVASVASVSQTGVVTAVAPGATTVSAALGGATGTITVVVSALTTSTKDTVVTLPATFIPNIVTIALGQSVTFVFGGGIAHNVIFKTSPAGAPADIQNATNLVFTRTFNTRGTFNYDCTVHPGMSGQVIVQ